jgi:hypothetical protein
MGPSPLERVAVKRLILAFLCVLLPASLSSAQTKPATGHPTVIVVVGAEGEPEFGDVFDKSADRWADVAHRAGANLIMIGREHPATAPTSQPASQPGTAPAASGPTEKEQFQKALADQPQDSPDQLWLVFIGHGTFDGHEAKVNLRGPDFSDLELAQWLRPYTRPIAIIDCTSASAPFLTHLSARGRVIIAATRSGAEVNYARFGEFMSVAIDDPAADLDKDGQVSLLEAFLAASHNVEDFYKREGRLATEHALLDDNGDGMGTPPDWFQGVRANRAAANGAAVDGARAHQWHLLMSPAELALSPEVRAKRNDLELQIEALRNKKPILTESEYYAQLDALMLSLARLYHSSDKKNPG